MKAHAGGLFIPVRYGEDFGGYSMERIKRIGSLRGMKDQLKRPTIG